MSLWRIKSITTRGGMTTEPRCGLRFTDYSTEVEAAAAGARSLHSSDKRQPPTGGRSRGPANSWRNLAAGYHV
ncbi:MAG TPA: hypothetical protein VGM73_17660 [Candidatus Didemnitutus sp.]|jgi:hypothetical protein